MSDFEINKGVGREVEFKGLRAQYLFIFAFGLLAVFVVFVIMYTAGIGQWTCIGFGVSAATAVVWLTFSLNRRFGIAEPAFRQPRTDEAPCRPAASQANPLTQTHHTSD